LKGGRASISGVAWDRDAPEEVAGGGRTDVSHREGGGGSLGDVSDAAENAAHGVGMVIANRGATEDEMQCPSQ
jgi:hypothetical protein